MQPKDRVQEAVDYMTIIVQYQGRQYALGLFMGILARLARVDHALMRELKDRSQNAQDSAADSDN